MSKGKNIRETLGVQGQVTSMDSPDYAFLLDTSLIKHPNYNLGDKVELPDGREFRYSKSTGAAALGTNLAVSFSFLGYTAITAFAVSAAVGDKEITIPAATHAALAEDELRGGYVMIYDGSDSTNNQFRQIIGNDASVLNVAFKIYLDMPLTYAITAATSKAETFQNPWGAMTASTDVALAKAGNVVTKVTAAAKYFWTQTKGWSMGSPQALLTAKQVGICWRHDGSMDTASAGIDAANAQAAFVASQYAGFRVLGDYTGNGPLVFLQGA